MLNVAIEVDGKKPIRCVSRFYNKHVIQLQCWKRLNEENADLEHDIALSGAEVCSTFEDLNNLSLSSPCVLLKACLLALGFAFYQK